MTKIQELKKRNILSVRSCFYQGGVWTKNSLCMNTGLSHASATNIIQLMIGHNEILYIGDEDSTGGRKLKKYSLNPDYSHIGVMICTNTEKQDRYKLSIYNLQSEVLESVTILSENGLTEDIKKIISFFKKDKKIVFLSIAVAVRQFNTKSKTCNHYRWDEKELTYILNNNISIPYHIESDIDAACIGLSKQYPTAKSIALINQSENGDIKCGIVIDKQIYRGAHQKAGEIDTVCKSSNSSSVNLIHSIKMLSTVLDPEVVAWHSECIERLNSTMKKFKKIQNFDDFIRRGLFEICIDQLLNTEKEEELC